MSGASMSPKASTAFVLCGLLVGCLQGSDAAYLPVTLPPPYSDIPDAPPGAPIEPGLPVKLDPRQQEAVVAAVSKWMKNPASASFGSMAGAKLPEGRIAVCGEVDGRNSAGAYSGMARFVGVMMGADFIVVSIAQSGTPRAAVDSICQKSGIFSG
jgi:hypothetical protein